jgi:hypothetical protein
MAQGRDGEPPGFSHLQDGLAGSGQKTLSVQLDLDEAGHED